MATVRDIKTIESCLTEDSRTFVFNWLTTPLQKKDSREDIDMSARFDEILGELQEDNDLDLETIRLK